LKLTYLLNRIELTAESPMEAQLLAEWVKGNVRHSSSCYVCDNRYPGPTTACFEFTPLTATQVAHRRRLALWWRLKEAWRRVRTTRLRFVRESD
jgi:hypothetical protein